MNNIVNLNKFRKKKNREAAETLAEENRTKFGRSKAQRKIDQNEVSKTSRHLDEHKLDEDES